MFVATYLLVSLVPVFSGRPIISVLTAALFSYTPFVLAIIALDIIIGLPELGWSPNTVQSHGSAVTAFLFELVYLLDNHFFLCMILSVPLLFAKHNNFDNIDDDLGSSSQVKFEPKDVTQNTSSVLLPDSGELNSPFFKSLSPAFQGALLRAEAQEHYIRLIGTEETRMILYRFSDVLRELPDELGLQVHRSHWIAYDGVKRVFRAGGNTRIQTVDGVEIPVSRRFSKTVMTLLSDHIDDAASK
ncbi:MAG: LytTR family DNA-binding domain-containing protein [Roseibium sp.]